MKKSRLSILLWMFLGHPVILLILFLLSYLKGFDLEEFNILFNFFFVLFLIYFSILIDYLIVYDNENADKIDLNFNPKIIFFLFLLITGIITIKAVIPQIINFKEMLWGVATTEFLLHVYIFYIYVIKKNREDHLNKENGVE